MLERQINPHFLFNTLELISGLILDEKEEEAISLCGNLGQLYRYNLRQEKWIQLREEIEYTKRYLEIMQYKVCLLYTSVLLQMPRKDFERWIKEDIDLLYLIASKVAFKLYRSSSKNGATLFYPPNFLLLEYLVPVSYTHLDVYKRQP